MFLAIEKQFGEEKAVSLLGNKENQMEQIKTKCLEQSYADACAQNIMQRGNPQESIVNAPPKVNFNSNFSRKPSSSNQHRLSNNENQKNNESRVSNENKVPNAIYHICHVLD